MDSLSAQPDLASPNAVERASRGLIERRHRHSCKPRDDRGLLFPRGSALAGGGGLRLNPHRYRRLARGFVQQVVPEVPATAGGTEKVYPKGTSDTTLFVRTVRRFTYHAITRSARGVTRSMCPGRPANLRPKGRTGGSSRPELKVAGSRNRSGDRAASPDRYGQGYTASSQILSG